MKKIVTEATKVTPEIILDGAKGYFFFGGKSYPENTDEIYAPVHEYIEENCEQLPSKITIEFKWLYFNSSTLKHIIKIIKVLKRNCDALEVLWLCKKDFDMVIELGEEIKEGLDVDLKIVISD